MSPGILAWEGARRHPPGGLGPSGVERDPGPEVGRDGWDGPRCTGRARLSR